MNDDKEDAGDDECDNASIEDPAKRAFVKRGRTAECIATSDVGSNIGTEKLVPITEIDSIILVALVHFFRLSNLYVMKVG